MKLKSCLESDESTNGTALPGDSSWQPFIFAPDGMKYFRIAREGPLNRISYESYSVIAPTDNRRYWTGAAEGAPVAYYSAEFDIMRSACCGEWQFHTLVCILMKAM